jgi:hypothetical protein
MRGRWTSHPKYGKQFEVFSYTAVLPATVQGIQRYLGSGVIKASARWSEWPDSRPRPLPIAKNARWVL